MKPLIIDNTSTTPKITLDKNSGIFRIEGISRPEDVMSFYNPIFDWFNEYMTNPNTSTTIEFYLEYHNTASAKIITKLISSFKALYDADKDVKIKWYYRENDEDGLEAGEDFKSLIDIPFELIKI